MATIGLDKLYYAKITEDATGGETYGTPIQLAKAIEANISVDLLESILYADDGADYNIREFKSGTLSLGVNNLEPSVVRDLIGATIDSNGVVISTGEDQASPVAVGFRAKSASGKYRYFWLYRVLFGVPNQSLKTRGDSIEFQTPTIEGKITRRNKVDGADKHPWKVEVTDGDSGVTSSTIESWFDSVYEPNYTVVSGTDNSTGNNNNGSGSTTTNSTPSGSNDGPEDAPIVDPEIIPEEEPDGSGM